MEMKLLRIVIVSELLLLLLLLWCLSLASSKKVPLIQRAYLDQRNGLQPAARSELTVSAEAILKGGEQDRVAFITARINGCTLPDAGKLADQYLQGGGDGSGKSARTPLLSGLTVGAVNYLIRVGLGTPAHDLYLAVDTGSDLLWTQCLPCRACFKQHDPFFVPSSSSSYQQISCGSPQCAQLGAAGAGLCSSRRPNPRSHCDYFIGYLDGSFTTGDFALEALTMAGDARPVTAAYPFGCGHINEGLFVGMDGIIGFSRNALAFPAQTKAAYGEVFGYCMPDFFSAGGEGYMEFGAAVASSEAGSSSTPLVELRSPAFYAVELEGIAVGSGGDQQGMMISAGRAAGAPPGRSKAMVVDSGTVLTRLDQALYEQVRDAYKVAGVALRLEEAPAGAGLGVFDVCYSGITSSVQVPRITFTFMGGLAFTPSAHLSLFPIDKKGTSCLALLPLVSTIGLSILGSYHQQGRLFTFDIPHSSLSISSNPC